MTETAVQKAIEEAEKQKGLKAFKEIYAMVVQGSNTYPNYTPDEWFSLMMNLGKARSIDQQWTKPWTVNDYNGNIYSMLSMYFSGNSGFETLNEGFKLNKGLLLIGNTGCGKTMIMELNSINPKMCFSVHDCLKIANEYADQAKESGGTKIINRYASPNITNALDKHLGQSRLTRFFDDLGAEGTVKHYGNEKNVMSDIIQEVYKNFQKGHPAPHFTSNLIMREIADHYGVRVADRLAEMCNVIVFPQQKSWRI